MVDVNAGLNQPQDNSQAQEDVRTFTQDEVNDLVGRNRLQEREKAKRMEEEYQSKIRQMQQQLEQHSQQAYANDANMQDEQSFNNIDARVNELLEEREQQRQAALEQEEGQKRINSVLSGFEERLQEAKKVDPDIEKALEGLQLQHFPNLVIAAHDLPGGALALKELAVGDPDVFLRITEKTPEQAKVILSRIVSQVNKEQEERQGAENMPPAPLDRPNPSHTSSGMSENADISDLRNLDWLRA